MPFFRYSLNIIASIFVAIGVIFDAGVWYLVKDLKIFDDDETNEKDTKLTNLNIDDGKEKEIMIKR